MHATAAKNGKTALAPTKSQLAEEQTLDSMIAGIPDATSIKNRDVADRIVCQVATNRAVPLPETSGERFRSMRPRDVSADAFSTKPLA
jgi:hypothetical protein